MLFLLYSETIHLQAERDLKLIRLSTVVSPYLAKFIKHDKLIQYSCIGSLFFFNLFTRETFDIHVLPNSCLDSVCFFNYFVKKCNSLCKIQQRGWLLVIEITEKTKIKTKTGMQANWDKKYFTKAGILLMQIQDKMYLEQVRCPTQARCLTSYEESLKWNL